MRETVKQLLELQELEIVLAETKILHQKQKDTEATKLEQRVQELRGQVPDKHLRRYDNLRRNGLAVVPEAGGVCSGCRLNIPRGDLMRMQNGSAPCACPNCARFLDLSC